jgi:hypothetical protein
MIALTSHLQHLVNEIRKELNRLSDSPFPELRKHLKMAERENATTSEFRAYEMYILKEARGALIEREEAIIGQGLYDKRVEVLSVSAMQYHLCVNSRPDEEPKISPEATGIPALRRYLFGLPAQSNFQTLYRHVFDTLPDLVIETTRVLDKFSSDRDYSRLREHVLDTAAILPLSLKNLARSLPREHVAYPWVAKDKRNIIPQLTSVIYALPHQLHYPTFEKMLRENGIPANGKGLGRNLNGDISAVLGRYIETWYNGMTTHIKTLADQLEFPLRSLQRNVKDCIGGISGNLGLRQAADDALDRTSRRLGIAYGELLAALRSTLRGSYLDFTTETNIYCPFARELKPIYQSTLQQRRGKGVYSRKVTHLSEAITIKRPGTAEIFIERMKAEIMNRQVNEWSRCCDDFVNEAIALLREFERITQELLDDEVHKTPGFRHAQMQLKASLPLFQKRLQLLQEQFSQAGKNPHNSATNAKRRRDNTRSTTDSSDWSVIRKRYRNSDWDRARPVQR